ncbi:MAG: OsmC family protein [Anaerolineaceae bacterium]|nr:OsmC family protein [Anaerolineaceae bacterium]
MVKTVKVDSTWKGGMRIDVAAGAHTLVVDQPANMGGKDEGANPLQYQLVSLGGCIGTIALIVAKQERIALKALSVAVEADLDTDFLMGKTTEGRAGFTEIRVNATIDADMTDEEKKEFLERVDARCPISDILANESNVVINVA